MTRNRYATQGACIVEALKRKPHTYAEMHALGVSTSPQKRVAEHLSLRPDLRLEKGRRSVGAHSLITWRVVKA